ncbi:cyclic nucleotide-binding domain-containing protein [Acidiferrimicrobium sp. IK]|uniref:Crp/Fnr family transcriptional regulator n=1 Tax=Acidiferrimicrobium sp. IK TaxID=2871700 RepID=UPI0021CB7BD2|nr:cyclic nucleotide-binding domain-containing protein [Acidiferrimicrobium sp. IK]MCU4186871.1 cyclic nucleotide-binding domain-containing protein [Acidiferrimicrobium sp. IK]
MVFRLQRNDKIERIKRLSILEGLSRSDLAAIAEVVVEEEVSAGGVLTREGQQGGVAYVIVSGTAEVTRGGRSLAVVGPGEVVGEMSLLDGEPRTATVTATTDLQVLVVDATDFNALLAEVPRLAFAILGTLARRIRTLDTMVESL